MPVLTSQQRKILETRADGRRASEQAVTSCTHGLAVTAERPPAHLDEDERQLRRGLRAKARQLGDTATTSTCSSPSAPTSSGTACCSPASSPRTTCCSTREYQAPVTLEDCEELAESTSASQTAGRSRPLRRRDPAWHLPAGRPVRPAAPRAGGPASAGADPRRPAGEVFAADDALGWVYQFWQKDKKDEVNASERKIGGADLGPVTQLFTENYMVRFLLENSLGAWWAARHPDSPLVKDFEYLRFDDDGKPAAGTFDGWPEQRR